MKTYLTYGFGITLASSVVMMLLHVAGYTTDPDKFMTGVIILVPISLIITIVGLILGMRAKRSEAGPEGFSYGKSLKTGILITLFLTIFGAGFNALYFKYINPDYQETAIAWTRNFMEKKGVPEDVITQTEEKMRADISFSKQITKGLINSFLIGAVLSLICAGFVRRPPAEPPLEDVAPTPTA